MSISTQALVRDNATLVNFKLWAKAISDFFTTAGWVQGADTGQVNWSTIASVPTAGNYVYEIWKPNDGLTLFYLKVEYGSVNVNSSSIRMSIGTATNGAGTLSGFVTAIQTQPQSASSMPAGSTSIQWQCHFSGDTGRMCIMMWRDDTGPGVQVFVIQRSLNSSGTPTSSYVTLISAAGFSNGATSVAGQQSVVFGVGVTVAAPQGNNNGSCFFCIKNQGVTSDLFNGQVALSPIFPSVGYFDNPLDAAAVGSINDFTEGSQYVISSGNMPYGVSHTYIAAKKGDLGNLMSKNFTGTTCFLMRYD